MLEGLRSSGLFIIQTLFFCYMMLGLLRVILQRLGASFYNPVCQLIVKLTQLPFKLLRRYIPGYWGIDFAGIVFVICLAMLKITLIFTLSYGSFPYITGLLVWSCAEVVDLLIRIFLYSIILQALMSWISPYALSPLHEILAILTEPILKSVRRIIPPINGFDLSPIPATMLLICLQMIVANPLLNLGYRLSF